MTHRIPEAISDEPKISIDSRDIALHFYQNIYNAEPTIENYLNLKAEENRREYFDNTFSRLALAFGTPKELIPETLQLSVEITQK